MQRGIHLLKEISIEKIKKLLLPMKKLEPKISYFSQRYLLDDMSYFYL